MVDMGLNENKKKKEKIATTTITTTTLTGYEKKKRHNVKHQKCNLYAFWNTYVIHDPAKEYLCWLCVSGCWLYLLFGRVSLASSFIERTENNRKTNWNHSEFKNKWQQCNNQWVSFKQKLNTRTHTQTHKSNATKAWAALWSVFQSALGIVVVVCGSDQMKATTLVTDERKSRSATQECNQENINSTQLQLAHFVFRVFVFLLGGWVQIQCVFYQFISFDFLSFEISLNVDG